MPAARLDSNYPSSLQMQFCALSRAIVRPKLLPKKVRMISGTNVIKSRLTPGQALRGRAVLPGRLER